MRQRDDGACYVYTKSDGPCYVLPRSEYARLKLDWMAGRQAFFECIGFYGGAMTFKLGDVIGINDASPESLAAAKEDRDADEREDAITA